MSQHFKAARIITLGKAENLDEDGTAKHSDF